MTDAELDGIEREVGFRLPLAYRRVASEQPFRPIGTGSVYWFFDMAGAVVEETLHPQVDSEQNLPRLAPGWLAIGFSAGGDTYVMDTLTEGYPVHCLSHETCEIEPDFPSFGAFVADWLEAPERIRAELDAASAEARAFVLARMRRAGRIVFWWSLPFVAFLVLARIIAWSNG